MMRSLLISSFLIVVLCSSSLATADDKYYVKGGFGNIIGSENERTNEVESGGDNLAFEMQAEGGVAFSLGFGVKTTSYLSTEFTLQQNIGNDLKGDLLINGKTIAESTGQDAESYILTEADTLSVMVTAQFDINALTKKKLPIDPYVGLGLGWAKINLGEIAGKTFFQGTLISESQIVSGGNSDGAAWRVSVGFTRPINKRYAIGVHYQYSNYGSVAIYDNEDGREIDLVANEIFIGLKYSF